MGVGTRLPDKVSGFLTPLANSGPTDKSQLLTEALIRRYLYCAELGGLLANPLRYSSNLY